MYAVLALVTLTILTWAVAVAATYAEDDDSSSSNGQAEKTDQAEKRRMHAA